MVSTSSSQSHPQPVGNRLAKCYERGVELMRSGKDFDYAHVMFMECVLGDPANLKFVETMFQNLRAKIPEPRRGILRFGHGCSSAMKQSVAEKKWSHVLRLGVDELKNDPWDTSILRAMAEACAALHYNEVELVYLKQALDADPKNVEVNRHCGHSLARLGQFDQAIACWHRVETLKKGDQEAPRMVSRLYEEKLKYPGGRPPLTPTPAVAEPKDESKETVESSAAQSLGEMPQSPIQVLRRAIAANPTVLANYLELSDLLCDASDFKQAESILTRAEAACGSDAAIADRREHVRELRLQSERAAAEARQLADRKRQRQPFHMPWLELMLVIAATVLALQFFPAAAQSIWERVDPRGWPRMAWFVINAAALLTLIAFRHGIPKLNRSHDR